MKRFLEFLGFEPGRFFAKWISGSEAQKFADTVKQISDEVKALGPNKKMRDV
jgi:coenzyme F420-reducing hydrogenase delta subunit